MRRARPARAAGDERVLDAGCGSGRVTEALIERLPRGQVIAVDESPSMIDAARERLGPRRRPARARPARARARAAARRDLLDGDLPLDRRPRPAVRAPARGAAPRRAAGRAVRGRGQHRRAAREARTVCAREPYAEHFASFAPPWNYAAAERHARAPARRGLRRRRLLAHAGAARARAPARVPLRRSCSARTSSSCRRSCASRSWTRCSAVLGEPVVVDYVRLNIDAIAEP